jgi:hypothetical protein
MEGRGRFVDLVRSVRALIVFTDKMKRLSVLASIVSVIRCSACCCQSCPSLLDHAQEHKKVTCGCTARKTKVNKTDGAFSRNLNS